MPDPGLLTFLGLLVGVVVIVVLDDVRFRRRRQRWADEDRDFRKLLDEWRRSEGGE